jgi:hypothetical protein
MCLLAGWRLPRHKATRHVMERLPTVLYMSMKKTERYILAMFEIGFLSN